MSWDHTLHDWAAFCSLQCKLDCDLIVMCIVLYVCMSKHIKSPENIYSQCDYFCIISALGSTFILRQLIFLNNANRAIKFHRHTHTQRGMVLRLSECVFPNLMDWSDLKPQKQRGEKTECLRSQRGQWHSATGREPPLHTWDAQNTKSAILPILLP